MSISIRDEFWPAETTFSRAEMRGRELLLASRTKPGRIKALATFANSIIRILAALYI